MNAENWKMAAGLGIAGGSAWYGNERMKSMAEDQTKAMKAMMAQSMPAQDLSRSVAPAEVKSRSAVKRKRKGGGTQSRSGLLTSSDGNTTKLGGY